MNYTPNNDPNYYIENRWLSNCGSFALRIEEWYYPNDHFESDRGMTIEEWIQSGIDEGIDEFELSDVFAEILAGYVLDDFDDVTYLYDPSQLAENEELIAFRTFVDYDCNWDFHFKVLRDGIWQEKCGSKPVQFCDECDWRCDALCYISNTIYFSKKLPS